MLRCVLVLRGGEKPAALESDRREEVPCYLFQTNLGGQLPVASLLLIVMLCFGSAPLAIRRPMKRMRQLFIVDTIKLQQ